MTTRRQGGLQVTILAVAALLLAAVGAAVSAVYIASQTDETVTELVNARTADRDAKECRVQDAQLRQQLPDDLRAVLLDLRVENRDRARPGTACSLPIPTAGDPARPSAVPSSATPSSTPASSAPALPPVPAAVVTVLPGQAPRVVVTGTPAPAVTVVPLPAVPRTPAPTAVPSPSPSPGLLGGLVCGLTRPLLQC